MRGNHITPPQNSEKKLVNAGLSTPKCVTLSLQQPLSEQGYWKGRKSDRHREKQLRNSESRNSEHSSPMYVVICGFVDIPTKTQSR